MDARIYVACLACYNDGRLHGEWMDADDADTIQEKVTALQAKCLHVDNDWAIHDYEGFHGIRLSESESFATVVELAEAIEEHGEAFAVWYDNEWRDSVDVEAFQEAYAGTFRNIEEWAEQWLEDAGSLSEIPENLRYYFDYASWARDCELGGDIWTHRGGDGVFVFNSH